MAAKELLRNMDLLRGSIRHLKDSCGGAAAAAAMLECEERGSTCRAERKRTYQMENTIKRTTRIKIKENLLL